MLLVINVIIT